MSKYYKNNPALLDLKIEESSMTFIIGLSGTGKTTLLKLILLMEKTSARKIIINGENRDKSPNNAPSISVVI